MANLQNPSRIEKLKLIGLDESCSKRQLSDKLLNNLYEKFLALKKEQEKPKPSVHISKAKNEQKTGKEDPKYKLFLEFLNSIMVKIGKDQINDITQFKEIKREDLLKPECLQVLNQYLERLTKQFDKHNFAYQFKDETESYIIILIKRITHQLGYNFESKKKETIKKANDEYSKRFYWYVYSIKN